MNYEGLRDLPLEAIQGGSTPQRAKVRGKQSSKALPYRESDSEAYPCHEFSNRTGTLRHWTGGNKGRLTSNTAVAVAFSNLLTDVCDYANVGRQLPVAKFAQGLFPTSLRQLRTDTANLQEGDFSFPIRGSCYRSSATLGAIGIFPQGWAVIRGVVVAGKRRTAQGRALKRVAKKQAE